MSRKRTATPVRPQAPAKSATPQVIAVCALLLLAVGLVFGGTVFNGFVNYDDQLYVYENPRVVSGLTAGGIGWAFTQRYASNWHPLTWLSHMLDSQLFGLNASGHHLTSVLLHAAAAVLLFLLLRQMTGSLWPSAFAAALFALHPLRVESVAWVAERKDVLSGMFFMLTLLAYARYVRRPASVGRYVALVAACALGLLAKPMLVTLPPLLLLLDYWPLGRARALGLAALVREKVPLLALSAASCAVTLWAQREAMAIEVPLPFSWRLGNALVAAVAYLDKFLRPVNLAVFYPHPGPTLPLWKSAAAALLVAGLTAGAIAMRRRKPHLFVGWFWFAGMLVPVIGLVQAGQQAMADRYTYLPQIGVALGVAWAGAAAARSGARRRWLPAAGGAWLALLAVVAWRQTGYWRDSETLYARALATTAGNHVAHNNLGLLLSDRGDFDAAITHYRSALEIQPDLPQTHANLGIAFAARGQIDAAIAEYQTALRLKPDLAQAHNNLGNALLARGRLDEAAEHFRRALEIQPDAPIPHNSLGAVLSMRGRPAEAIPHYQQALALNPDFAEAHVNLGDALRSQGRGAEAAEHYREALALAQRQGKTAVAQAARARLGAP